MAAAAATAAGNDHIPAVELFTTSILSNHKVRQRHERYLAVFAAKRVDFVYHDLASDEDAKKRFRRKALDPQIPNILVHNEWRGTFEEFEESVEFGELDIFLRIDPSKVQAAAATIASVEPAQAEMSALEDKEPIASRSTSTRIKLPPAPTAAPRMAPIGSGAGPRRNSIDDFLDSFDGSQLNLDSMSDADISSLLEEAESIKAKAAHHAAAKAPKSSQLYPGEAPVTASVKRTYFPSENAGTKPLRLPKMPGATTRATSASNEAALPTMTAANEASPSSKRSPSSPSIARFSSSQNSSRALAAEAKASSSNRSFSARQVRSGLDSGLLLQEVLSDSTRRSGRGGGEAEALLEELGLGDLNLTEEEAEAFLLDGIVPDGMELGGSKIRRSKANQARETEAARDVAAQARSMGDQRRADAAVARDRQTSYVAGQGEESADAEPTKTEEEKPVEVSDRTRDLLERMREKRASRMVDLSTPIVPAETAVISEDPAEAAEPTKNEEKSANTIEDPATDETAPPSEVQIPEAEVQEPQIILAEPMPEKAEVEAVAVAEQVPTAGQGATPLAEEAVGSSTLSPPPQLESEGDAITADVREAPTSVEGLPTADPINDEEVDEMLARLSNLGQPPVDAAVEPATEPRESIGETATSAERPVAIDTTSSAIQAEVAPLVTSEEETAPQVIPKEGSRRSSSITSPIRKMMSISPSSRKTIDVPRKMSTSSVSAAPKSPRSPHSGSNGNVTAALDTPSKQGFFPSLRRSISGHSSNQGSPSVSPAASRRTPSAGPAPAAPPLSPTSPAAGGLASPSGVSGATKSPRLKSRLPSMRSFGNLRRKSSHNQGESVDGPIGDTGKGGLLPSQVKEEEMDPTDKDEEPASPTRMTTGKANDDWRGSRTLSQILRDADAALANDVTNTSTTSGSNTHASSTPISSSRDSQAKRLSAGGVGGGGVGAMLVGGPGQRKNVRALPDDGLGEAEEQG